MSPSFFKTNKNPILIGIIGVVIILITTWNMSKTEVERTLLTGTLTISEKYKDPGYKGETNYIFVDKVANKSSIVNYQTYYAYNVGDTVQLKYTRFDTKKSFQLTYFVFLSIFACFFFIFLLGVFTVL